MGCHFLFQGIFLTQESNPGFPALQVDSWMANLAVVATSVQHDHKSIELHIHCLGKDQISKLGSMVSTYFFHTMEKLKVEPL